MVIKVQRWSPQTCGCVIEQQVDYDDEGKREPIVSFLMMNEVCSEHQHMASTRYTEDHEDRKGYVMNLINQAKERNLMGHTAAISRTRLKIHKQQLHDLTPQVHNHNANITKEWEELTEQAHCWDEHIYNHILELERKKNG